MQKPPCFKNGKDCPKRHKNCHSTCEEYAKFAAENQKRLKAKRANDVMINYVSSQIAKGKR